MKEKIVIITIWENCFCLSLIIKYLLEVLWLKIEIILGRHQFPHLRELWFRMFRFIKYPELEGTWGSWYTFISCLLRRKCLSVLWWMFWVHSKTVFEQGEIFVQQSCPKCKRIPILTAQLLLKFYCWQAWVLHWLAVTAEGAHQERWWSWKEGFE